VSGALAGVVMGVVLLPHLASRLIVGWLYNATGEHRVGSASSVEEREVVVDQRHPEPHHRLTGRSTRADQARVGHGHLGSSAPWRAATRLVEMFWKITGITSRSGKRAGGL
jgi:hypothetical protein